MSFCNIQIASNATVLQVDTRNTAWKVVFLPTASTNQGRVITIKDQYGTARISSFMISTTGLDLIDNVNNYYRFQSSLNSLTLLSDGQRSWQTISYVNDVNRYQSAFSPSSFSTMALWLDASDPWNRGSLSTVTRTILPIWYDKSGGQRNAIWSTTDASTRIQSTVFTGITSALSAFTVRMDQNLYACNPTFFSSGDTGTTAIFTLIGGGEYTFQQSQSTIQRRFYTDTAGSYNISYGANGGIYNNGNGGGSWTTGSFVWAPSTSRSYYRFNGNPVGNFIFNLSSILNRTTDFYIGGQPNMGGQSFRAFGGNIGEFLYYNSNLPSSQVQVLEGYLAWKWGIQGSLSNTHPYRFVTPSSYDVNLPYSQ